MENELSQIGKLIEIIDTLLGPNGCPWDQEQTLAKLRPDLIEEACEVIEAIDLNDSHGIEEELGDLLFVVLFFCRVAEKEKHTQISRVAKGISDKLIRRHPHVFGEVKIDNSDAVLKQWDQIKQKEKAHRKSALDGIPMQLPALARAQKVLKKMKKAHYPHPKRVVAESAFQDEDSLGTLLLDVVSQASVKGIDAEHALRKALMHTEKEFRSFENLKN